jgi:hypothetical protein
MEADMMRCARGPFEVKITPQSADSPAPPAGGAALGRMTIDKRYDGELAGAGTGEMLTAMTATKGSAAYVAVERVEGALHGRAGSFALQHTGVMARGEQRLTVAVVPDSGTGELSGISGRMIIVVDEGRHSYEFEYELPGD